MSENTRSRRHHIAGAAAIAACVAALGAAGIAQQPIVKGEPPTTVVATVDSIDRTDRSVLLKTADGDSITARVGDGVKMFDTLKVGDRVKSTYYETVVLVIEQPGAPPFTFSDVAATTPAAPGAKPGGTVARQIKAAVTVEEVRRDTSSMTVRGDRGRVVSFRVKDPKVFDQVKKGDRVDITYTEAMLVSLEP